MKNNIDSFIKNVGFIILIIFAAALAFYLLIGNFEFGLIYKILFLIVLVLLIIWFVKEIKKK